MNNQILPILIEAIKNWKTDPSLAADKIEIVGNRLLDIAKNLRNSQNPFIADGGMGDRIIIKVTREDGTIKQSVDTGQ